MSVVFSGWAGSFTSENATTFDVRIMAERLYVRVTEINVQLYQSKVIIGLNNMHKTL